MVDLNVAVVVFTFPWRVARLTASPYLACPRVHFRSGTTTLNASSFAICSLAGKSDKSDR